MSVALPLAAEITGLAQQALEKMHELRTYAVPSAIAFRYRDQFDSVYDALVQARTEMTKLALALGEDRAMEQGQGVVELGGHETETSALLDRLDRIARALERVADMYGSSGS